MFLVNAPALLVMAILFWPILLMRLGLSPIRMIVAFFASSGIATPVFVLIVLLNRDFFYWTSADTIVGVYFGLKLFVLVVGTVVYVVWRKRRDADRSVSSSK